MTESKSISKRTISQPVKVLTLVLFITAYSFVLPLGFVVIDPCSTTPGYDFSIGFLMLLFFPLFTGTLVYRLWLYEGKFRISMWGRTVLWSALCLVAGMEVIFMAFIFDQQLASLFMGTASFHWFFHFGCYNDIEFNRLPLTVLYILAVLFCGWIVGRKLKASHL